MFHLDRGEQYEERFTFVVDVLESIPDDPQLITHKGDIYEKLYSSIDAILEVARMVLEDLGDFVGEDYQNVLRLEQLGVIDAQLASRLIKCSGLKKIFVHKYDGFDERLALDSIDEIRETIYRFMDIIDGCLEEFEMEEEHER